MRSIPRLNFVKHFETVIESVFAERLKHKHKPNPDLKHHETAPDGGESIADAARDLQNTLWHPNPAKAGFYFLSGVVNNMNKNLLAEDRPISLFTTVDLGPLLRQIGQWTLLALSVVQQLD